MTRVDRTIVAEYEYDAWGKITSAEGPLADINPIRYRGYYYDTESGFYYCQSRYYNPDWCRCISADVFFDTGVGILGTNMYSYCNNNPVNLCDPSGTKSYKISSIGITNLEMMNLVNVFSFFTSLFGVSFNPSESTLLNMAVGLATERMAKGLGMEASDIVINATLNGRVLSGSVEFQAGGSTWVYSFVAGRVSTLREYGQEANERLTPDMGLFGRILVAFAETSNEMLASDIERAGRMGMDTDLLTPTPFFQAGAEILAIPEYSKTYIDIMKAIGNHLPDTIIVWPTSRLHQRK